MGVGVGVGGVEVVAERQRLALDYKHIVLVRAAIYGSRIFGRAHPNAVDDELREREGSFESE